MSKRQSLRGQGIDKLLFGISENHKEFEKSEAKSVGAVQTVVEYEEPGGLGEEFERVTVPLKRSQLEMLANLERLIRKNRSLKSRKQRITKNAIIRACLDVLMRLDFDLREIPDEVELARRMQGAVRS